MLKLRKMELKGFKSFYQPTQILFPDGITAVVGPNGCGKSNLSDAISWVLGSQSSKALRGVRMEDVIFNGSEKRGPLAMAEVKLSLVWGDEKDRDKAGAEADSFHPRPEVFEAARAVLDQDVEAESSPANGSTHGLESPGLEAIRAPQSGAAQGGAEEDSGSGNGHRSFTIPTRPGETVEVTRRLFRSGESEYRIDGNRCRLKDVQDLMRAARIGSRTYSVIEQGRISSLLSARPQERKELIEEAAGILGFKARRRTALLKLEATEANLSRLRDLISEVRRQANSLKRQAAAARRFRRNTEERAALQHLLFFLEHRQLAEILQGLDTDVDSLAAEDAAGSAAQARLESRLHALRQRLDEEGQGAADRREELHLKERENDRLTAALASLAERIQAAQDLAGEREAESRQLEGSAASESAAADLRQRDVVDATEELARRGEDLAHLEETYTGRLAAADRAARQAEEQRSRLLQAVGRQGECRNRAMQLEERGRQMKQRLKRLEAEKQDCAAEQAQAARRLDASSADLASCTRRAGEAANLCIEAEQRREQERAAASKALETLSEARRGLAALQEREAALAALWETSTTGAESISVGVPLGQDVEVRPEWEAAAGNWLGRLLNARLVKDLETALEFMEQAASSGSEHFDLVVEELIRLPAGPQARVLSTVLDGHQGQAGLLAAAAANPELVDDLATAVARFKERPGRAFLTRAGMGITASGVLTGGDRKLATRLLAGNRQRREASQAAHELEAQLPVLEQQAAAAEKSRNQAEAAVERARGEREARARECIESRAHQQRHLEEVARLKRRWGVIETEAVVLAEEEAAQHRDLQQVLEEQAAAEAVRQQVQEASQMAQRDLEALRQEIQTLAGERAELKSTHAARREALAALQQEMKRLCSEVARLQGRRQICETECRQQRVVAQDLTEERQRLEAIQSSLGQEIMLLHDRCQADEMSLREIRDGLPELETRARQAKDAGEEIRTRHQAKEVERAQAQAHQEDLERHCEEQFQCTPGDLQAGLSEEQRSQPAAGIKERLARLEEIRRRIGEVNLMALEQFAEAEDRQRFLEEQKADLDGSIESLQATIERINQTSRERFLAALEAIRMEFNRLFKDLFDGGHADIVLQDAENVLESGLEIIAQPPGKRTRSINLLSGGEKSLSAIALLFAIFRYRPSPFCLLDEVDAALDESNVERFARMLKGYGEGTQFIVITHNRQSMQIADVMYGVTMEEPGISQTVSLDLG